MGKKLLNEKLRVSQRSVGFKGYQIDFLRDHLDLDIDLLCRDAVDKQIILHNEAEKYFPKELAK